ncbi:hypothetical protein Aglo03_14550 [Actinokineospora globicatena]|uniref:Uncharacterized protein n=1 Tax=Actinokineospora globicatena TaxID=103729 RepID=A0A9W6QLD7_9PSEU|nr:hypothetical protein Aglo03_14550 [Actinokineospora globicatena]
MWSYTGHAIVGCYPLTVDDLTQGPRSLVDRDRGRYPRGGPRGSLVVTREGTHVHHRFDRARGYRGRGASPITL